MNIQETIISRTYENKFGEFFITLKVKAEDITLEEREASRAACREGTLMEVALEKFQFDEAARGKMDEFSKIVEKPIIEGMAGEHTYVAEKKPETIYQRFKRVCIDYSGEDYYSRLKKHLGVEHLKDLKGKYSESMVRDVLDSQEKYIFFRKRSYAHKAAKYTVTPDLLTHKDNAYNLWLELFGDFNNPKT